MFLKEVWVVAHANPDDISPDDAPLAYTTIMVYDSEESAR